MKRKRRKGKRKKKKEKERKGSRFGSETPSVSFPLPCLGVFSLYQSPPWVATASAAVAATISATATATAPTSPPPPPLHRFHRFGSFVEPALYGSEHLENETLKLALSHQICSEWSSARASERNGARQRSEQCGASEPVGGASERVSGRASGLVLSFRLILLIIV